MHLLWTVAWLLAAEPATPTAMVLAVNGNSTLQRGSTSQPLRTMDLLLPGDRLQAGDGGIRLVVLADGHAELLPAKFEAMVEDKGCTPADKVERQPGRLSPANLKRLRHLAESNKAGIGVLRDIRDQTTVPVVRPVYGAIVTSDHPSFSWPAVPDAVAYDVRLTSDQARGTRPEWRVTTTATNLPYPEKESVLPHAEVRYWQVTARTGGGKEMVVVQSKFSVATEEECNYLKSLRPLVEGDDPDGWLLAAATYEAYGVIDEALPLYEKLAARQPNQANVQAALASYYTRAGQKEKAVEARRRAEKLRGDARN